MAIKWGVIGCGGIADRRTIPEGIIPASNAQLVAVMDANIQKTKEISDKYKVRGYAKEEELLNDKEVEAVYIATPAYLHAPQTILACGHKKHILCEKPMALTLKECEEMVKAAEKNGVKLGIGFMMRFHAHHKKIKEMIGKGDLGKIVMGRAQLSCWYPPIPGAWRQELKSGGRGSLMDLGIHCIDVLEFILGSRVKEVSCFADTLIHNYEVEDSGMVMLKFENGAHGIVDSYFSIPDASSKNVLEVYGSKGSIIAQGTIGQMPTGEAMAYLEKVERGYEAKQERIQSVSEKIEVAPVNMYQAEIENFSRAIEEGTAPEISGEDGLWTQKVMLACYESTKKGKVVKL